MSIPSGITSQLVEIDGRRIHYLEAGSGETILLLHGWPTSAYLWRNLMLPLAETHHVVALDLPGFGHSAKNPADSYSFTYHERIIDGVLAKMGSEKISLVVHDLGGPIGIFWALRNPEKVSKLALLNTIIYPEFSRMVKLFVASSMLPGVRWWLSSKAGIEWAMRFGVHHKDNLTDQVLRAYTSPFKTKNERNSLLKTAHRLSMKGFHEITEKLPSLQIPVRLIYGENDRILPNVSQTMERVKRDIPHAELTSLPNCGHFLQEDEPDGIAKLLVEFFVD